MPVYRNISLSFWTDSKVDDDFTPEDKYFYLYLLTNPHTTISGCYEVSMKQMCRETGYNEDSVTRLLDRMEHQHGVVQYSRDTKEVLIVNWAKYNWTTSEKMLSGVMTAAHSIKCPEFRAFIAKKLKEFGVDSDTLLIGYQYPINCKENTVTDTVSVSVSEEENARAHAREENKAAEQEALDQFAGKMQDALRDWLTYKRQKRQAYKPQGLKSLVTQIKTNAEKYGEDAVISAIQQSMSSNYAGIVFDRIGKNGGERNASASNKPWKYDYKDDAETLPF